MSLDISFSFLCVMRQVETAAWRTLLCKHSKTYATISRKSGGQPPPPHPQVEYLITNASLVLFDAQRNILDTNSYYCHVQIF
jgi:hypothetical protein